MTVVDGGFVAACGEFLRVTVVEGLDCVGKWWLLGLEGPLFGIVCIWSSAGSRSGGKRGLWTWLSPDFRLLLLLRRRLLLLLLTGLCSLKASWNEVERCGTVR